VVAGSACLESLGIARYELPPLRCHTASGHFYGAAAKGNTVLNHEGIKPDFVLILPWNIPGEICQQHSYIREWSGKFVVAVSDLREVT
jgi:C-methyltransferase-like protein